MGEIETMKRQIDNQFIWLSAQRALLGAIDKHVCGVCVNREGDVLIMTVYLEGLAAEDEMEELEEASLLLHADVYAEILNVELRLVENAVNPLTTIGHWVFLRRGYQATH